MESKKKNYTKQTILYIPFLEMSKIKQNTAKLCTIIYLCATMFSTQT